MHIPLFFRQASSRRHRLYVAVPLFTLCTALSFGSGALRGMSADVGSEGGMSVEGEGAVSRRGDMMRLERGTALFAARGIATVEAGPFLARGWNGAFDLTLQEGRLDVAALTTPVIVRTRTNLWLVPAGTQRHLTLDMPVFSENPAAWAAAPGPVPLPAHYLRERLPAAERLLASAPFRPLDAATSAGWADMADPLRLSAARDRADAAEHAAVRRALHEALLAGDARAARDALLAESAEEALRDQEAASLLPELLVLAQRMDLASVLLPFFVQDPDHLLLALLHDDVRAHAWMLPWPDLGSHVRIAALLRLPAADNEHDAAMPSLAVERWGERWADLLLHTDIPGTFADAVLLPLERDVIALDRLGYPERARRYAAAAVRAFEQRRGSYSPKAIAVLERLESLSVGNGVVIEPVTVVAQDAPPAQASSASSAAEQAPSALEREDRMRTMLRDAGGMFTSKTVISAVAPDHVRVENVVFGTAAGDRLIGFTYDAAADLVIDIKKDGKLLPYGLPLARYLEWVRGE